MTPEHRRGAVRLRSNVVFADDDDPRAKERAWDLVPGEIVGDHRPRHLEKPLVARRRQRDERDYLFPCGECHRLIHRINLEGCSNPRCLAPPSDTNVTAARGRRDEALALIRAEEEHAREAGAETETEELAAVIDPEAAVDRLLGLQAVTQEADTEHEPQLPAPAKEAGEGLAVVARKALVTAAESTGRFTRGYASTPFDNIVDSLTLGQARSALDQLAEGDGTELVPQAEAPPKFYAAHSSAALAVNAFGVWLDYPRWLQVAGRAGFDHIEFEVKFPTGLSGNPPNLDLVLTGPDGAVAIESKCTEHLSAHVAEFPDSYDKLVAELAEESWQELFAELRSRPDAFRWVNAGQLVRHYLGLRRALLEGRLTSTSLVYLFWEPADGDDFDAVREHRDEVEALATRVSDPAVPFGSRSYPELWNDWSAPGAPHWVEAHVAALRQRYDVRLGEG